MIRNVVYFFEEGQIKVSQITRIVRGDKQALHVTVDIDRPDSYGVLPQSLTHLLQP